MRILVVEDNVRLCTLIVEDLVSAGYAVDYANSAADFQMLAASESHALYLIDLSLPDGDGINLIREIRGRHDATPILVMSARSTIGERVVGLDEGADDYMIKPFHHRELMARVRALCRRSPMVPSSELQAGQLMLDTQTGTVFCSGQRMTLRPSEQRLLELLIRRSGRLVARSAIESALRSMDDEHSSNAVDKLVSRLRQALSSAPSGLQLKTVRGAGYILEE